MKKLLYCLSSLLIAGALFSSCVKEKIEITGQGQTYTMTLTAGKGGDLTKALNIDGSGKLTAAWTAGDQVTVYNESTDTLLGGALEAQSAGASTRLSGTLSGAVSVGNTLTLRFLSPDYAAQDGTLDYIASNCDYATATVTVASTDGGVITVTEASADFHNAQAIVKFRLRNAANTADISAKPLKITLDGEEITVTPATATNELYVAVPAVSGKAVSMVATTSGGTKCYSGTGVTFAKGEYYAVTVRLSDATLVHNESELNAAIADNAYIVFANDISVGAYVKIGQSGTQRVRIDLNGYTLQRTGLVAVDSNGHVIEVFAAGTLTLQNGTLTGGWANNGGGVCNYGTLNLDNVTVTGCQAVQGGGIKNNGGATLNLYNNVIITGNSSTDNGGGIWNGGTLNVGGIVVVYGNVKGLDRPGNLFLTSGHNLSVTGDITGSYIVLSMADGSGVFTSGLSDKGDETCFGPDYPQAATVTLEGGEAKLQPRTDRVYYIDHTVEGSTVVTNPDAYVTEYITLSGANDHEQLLQDGVWYVIREAGVSRGAITVSGITHAHIILCDGASLSAIAKVAETATLEIYGQSADSGKWTAHAANESKRAGMGAGLESNNGHIYIHGGTIDAEGDLKFAGIGGGHRGDGGDIRIYGGNVTARGGKYAAGIGGGQFGNGADLLVYGGVIKAYGGSDAAGIGSGEGDLGNGPHGGNCSIYGGTVTAVGGDLGAGIGGGQDADGCLEVHIYGGSVYASGGTDGAGIGSGESFSGARPRCLVVNISGGYVEARGKGYGAGIGGGLDSFGGTVTFSGGTTLAYSGGGDGAAAIGSNLHEGNMGTIIWNGELRVRAGNTLPVSEVFSATGRTNGCWWRKYARIEPCTHDGNNPCTWCGHQD